MATLYVHEPFPYTIQKPHYVQSSRIPLNPPHHIHIYIYTKAHSILLFVKKEALLNLKKERKGKRRRKRGDGERERERGINERDSESDTRAQTDRAVDIDASKRILFKTILESRKPITLPIGAITATEHVDR